MPTSKRRFGKQIVTKILTGAKATVKINGQKVDMGGGTLTVDMIENAAIAAASNFGQPNHIFLPINVLSSMGWSNHPEYEGTEWEHYARITKREHAFAKLQCFLLKFGLQKHLDEPDDRRADAQLATKRLKRAKWARYQQKKAT